MSASAIRRAVADVLGHGLNVDLARSVIGVELRQHLQSGLTADVADGAKPGELLEAMRDACGYDAVAYARCPELVVLAGRDELQVLVDPPESDLAPHSLELPPAPPAPPARRRR